MSARPPFDDLPREPLDAEEAAIARVQRALPAAEPPSALDARILSQARAAVNKPTRRPRPWFMSAGFGAAAAAVMAAGIGWQLGWIGSIPGSATQVPAESSRADGVKAEADSEGLERIDVELIRREQSAEVAPQPVATSAPRPPAPVQKQRAAAPPAPSPEVSPAVPPAPPPPPAAAPEPFAQDAAPAAAPAAEPSTDDMAADAAAPAPQAFPGRATSALGATAGSAQPAEERKRDADALESEQLESITVTGNRVAKARAALPPWNDDVQLAPDDWLERIREREQNGDRQGAEHSLRRFVLSHPQRAVPRELQRLLVE